LTSFCKEHNWHNLIKRVNKHPSNINEIQDSVEGLNPFLLTGYTLTDKNGNQATFKSATSISASVSLGFMNKFNPFNLGADNFEEDCLLEMHRLNRVAEFLSYYPKWKAVLEKAGELHHKIVSQLQHTFDSFKGVESEKDFAEKVKNLQPVWQQSILFEWRREGQIKPAEIYIAALSKKKWRTIADTMQETNQE